MAFTGQGSNIHQANDVAFDTLGNQHIMRYNSNTAKWNNVSVAAALAGMAALANQGGREMVSTINATGSVTLNLANGNIFNVTLSGNTTFAFTGATNNQGCSFTLYLRQGTSPRTVAWPNAVRWSGGAPMLSGANSVDILVFETLDGGANWYGSVVGTNFI